MDCKHDECSCFIDDNNSTETRDSNQDLTFILIIYIHIDSITIDK